MIGTAKQKALRKQIILVRAFEEKLEDLSQCKAMAARVSMP